MEIYIKDISDITYMPEFTLDTNTMKIKLESFVSKVKFNHQTYVHYRSVSLGFI
jgi:hypothetical protein